MTHIDTLRNVIHELHGTESTHRKSVPMKETWQGQTVWEGVVEVFTIHGHPQTYTLYAWSHDTDDPEEPKRHVTVLHIHPATTPLAAVSEAILQEYSARAEA